ncbi:efflux RND transporter periplasmic adaptor subunit [Listeria ivanovii subsp. londoniensis]|uniref:Efflux RND transporter periplasmic adaptor subunit n=1 Tax=Listeria ivanovii subsp. londoniensis TaxID=202752 RepID=A0ABS1G1K7_LISIV|nr:HlyD family efflux transporter periplasmic adaptor subunit [Listeria ivanovii]MBK1960748.1 efflux RND transporter periplasmic adaptor subunit [Listeria ivanovii subsp. londoniensis]
MENQQQKKKKKKIILIILCVVLVLVALFAAIFIAIHQKNKVTVDGEEGTVIAMQVKELSGEGEVDSGNYFTGVIEPKATSKYNIDSSKGTVNKCYVKVGDTVKKDQKLYSYSNPEGDLEVREAELELEMQKSTTSQQQATINKLTKQIKDANEEEQDALKQEKAQAELELKQASFGVEKAEAALKAVQSKNNNNVVYSTVSGVVKQLDQSQMNKTVITEETNPAIFMEIVDMSTYYIKGSVDEFRRDELKKDQKVTVINRQDESETWEGKISEVGELPDGASEENTTSDEMEMEENPNLTKYPFTVELSAAKGLNIGRHVFISLDVEGNDATSDTLSLPSDFLVEKDGKTIVWTANDGTAKATEVKTGEKNEELMTVEITEGLTTDDYIIYPDSFVKEGMEVQNDAPTE